MDHWKGLEQVKTDLRNLNVAAPKMQVLAARVYID